MSEILHLNDIHVSKNIITLFFESKVIRLWHYDVNKLKQFILCILCKNKYDIGVVVKFNINNRNNISHSFLRLVYSNWYRYEDRKCIESLISGGTENDTITLFVQDKEIIKFRPNETTSSYSELFSVLYILLDSGAHEYINRKISSMEIYKNFKEKCFDIIDCLKP